MRKIVLLLLSAWAAIALVMAVAFSGDPPSSTLDERVKVAKRAHDDASPAFIRIVYKIKTEDNKTPGAIAIYLHPHGVQSADERVFVNRIFPFSPTGSGGVRQTTVQLPKELAQRIKADASPVMVELEYDPTLTAVLPAEGTLSLEEATIVGN
jgi:hypothetical protein